MNFYFHNYLNKIKDEFYLLNLFEVLNYVNLNVLAKQNKTLI